MQAGRVLVPLVLAFLISITSGCPPTYGGCLILPYDDEFNRDISNDPVDYMSDCYLRAIGESFAQSTDFARRAVHLDFGFNLNDGYGIPYNLGNSKTSLVPVVFGGTLADGTSRCNYSSESDQGPYQISTMATIEGSTGPNGDIPPPDDGSDHHLISLNTDDCILYETYNTKFISGTNAASGVEVCSAAKFDLTKKLPSRPLYYTSADAAGMPIFPGLLKYDEAVSTDGITHATRLTVLRAQQAFTTPASHFGQYQNTTYLPYGARLRLKASVDESVYTDKAARGVVKGWKQYGLILADQGSTMFVSGTSDARWETTIDQINSQHKLYHDDFEVVQIYQPITRDPRWNPAAATCDGKTTNSNSNWQPAAAKPCCSPAILPLLIYICSIKHYVSPK